MSSLAATHITPPSLAEGWGWSKLSRWEVVALGATLLTFVGLASILAAQGTPLTHDEAVYATRGRHYAVGGFIDIGYWNDYRAEGLPLLFAAVWWLTGTELGLRMVVILTAVAAITLTWAWTRYYFDAATALVAAVMLALLPEFFVNAALLLPEVPATALGMLAIIVFARACRGDGGVGRLAYLSVPLAIAATYVRYGAPTFIGAGMGVIALANWHAVRRSLARTSVIALTTLGSMLAILLIPIVTNSTTAPGIAFRDRQTAKNLSSFASYRDLAEFTPDLFGWPLGVATTVGLIAMATALVRRQVPRRAPAITFAIFALFVITLNLGLAQLEPRYLTPALPWLVPLPAAGLVWLARSRRTRAWTASVAIVGALAVAAAALGSFSVARSENELTSSAFGPLREAARQLDERTDAPCLVVTGHGPQAIWYSNCVAAGYPRVYTEPDAVVSDIVDFIEVRRPELDPDMHILSMYLERGKRQPTGAYLAALEQRAGPKLVEVGASGDGARQHIWIVELGTWGALLDRNGS